VAETSIRFKVETRDANKKVAQLERQVRKLEVAVVKAGGTTRAAGSGFKAFGSSAAAASVGVKGFGAALSAALGPVTAVVAAVGSLGQVFGILKAQDFAEAKVRTLGVNSEELKGKLAGVSRELSGQASVLDLTSAAYDVASAGFASAGEASQILKASSQAATGGFTDLNTAADAVTSVLNAYGLGADKAGEITDRFIQTQNDGKIVIGEYAANIAKVAPVAAALKIPLEEINAAVAQITGGGQGAEVTFTALKTALAQLASGNVGEKLKKFGVNIDSNTLAADGFIGTLKKIKESGADTGEILKAFGTEAGPVLQPLLNDFGKLNTLLDNQKKSQGKAALAAFEATDTIEGSIKRLSTAFQNIFSDSSELGLLLKGTFQVAAVTVEVFGAAIKSLLAPFRGAVLGIQDFIKSISPLEDSVNIAFELEKGFQAYMKAVEFATAVVTGFFRKFTEGAYKLVGDFLNFAGTIRGGIINIFSGIGQFIGDQLKSVYKNLDPNLKYIIEQAMAGARAIKGAVSSVIGAGVGKAQSAVQDLAKAGGFGATSTQQPGAQQPTAQNTINQTNGGLTDAGKQKLDMSEKMLELNRKLREESELGNEREVATLQLMIDRQKIAESNLTPVKEINALEEATFKFRKKVFALDKKISDQKEANAKKLAEAAEKARENDPLVQMQKELDKLISKETQALHAATSIGNAFTNAFGDVITGTKSVSEAGADMLKSIASDFLAMAKKIIAQQLAMILYGTIMKALGIGGGFNSAAASPGGSAGVAGIGGGGLGDVFGNTSSFGAATSLPKPFAQGGFVSSPTNALIGEGGEPEYVVPASKMNEAMGRYARGARGGAVIPDGPGGDAGGEMGGGGGSIDVTYSVERINNVNYVTAAEFERGMAQAAKRGAEMGKRGVYSDLINKRSIRSRVGI